MGRRATLLEVDELRQSEASLSHGDTAKATISDIACPPSIPDTARHSIAGGPGAGGPSRDVMMGYSRERVRGVKDRHGSRVS
jgi:hypothetical protein